VYGLSADLDLSFLVGREVIQVCLGSSQVQLHFSALDVMRGDYVEIFVESELTHISSSGVESSYVILTASAPMLTALLGATVNGASREAPGTLCLQFETGDRLKIHDNSEHYESYQIKQGNKLIVV
jgi:hypothetical protein